MSQYKQEQHTTGNEEEPSSKEEKNKIFQIYNCIDYLSNNNFVYCVVNLRTE